MKVATSVKCKCPHCKISVRSKRKKISNTKVKVVKVIRVDCRNPRHKQRQAY